LFFVALASTATYTLSLHDALPIWPSGERDLHRVPGLIAVHGGELTFACQCRQVNWCAGLDQVKHAKRHQFHESQCWRGQRGGHRSEEHTSELQSRENLVCRLLLEK